MGNRKIDVLVVGVALFAMFFGAGNLIFPPYMGLLAGASWSLALAGFLITGIGMPLLGIMASARAGGSVEHLAGRVSPLFGRVLSIVVILAIGPLLAIPRTGATTFELGILPVWPWFSPALFSVIYFGVTLFFALNQSAVIDKIGKYLTPFLLLTLAWIIVAGVLSPLGPMVDQGLERPFARGFREGYQTMDAMASIVFAEIIIAALVYKGYKTVADQVKLTSIAGLIAAIGLGLVYGGLMYVGATAFPRFPIDTERTSLLVGITQALLGGTGKIALGGAVALACLTTSIGLTATVGDYFSGLTKGRLGYRTICVLTVVFSAIFATVGVTTIVTLAVPLLVTVYPVAIVLIILTMLEPLVTNRLIYIGAVIGALSTSIPDALTSAGLPIAAVNVAIARIPLAEPGFPWIVPALLGGVIGAAFAATGRGSDVRKARQPAGAHPVHPPAD
ncbi:MAG: branched-chain amino acid transport system II carrier protein [Acidobacteria bacterium]|nr:MAG: branched-chain amino acid transport system II carrier protein [Acidobacteriota bacterium]